MHSLDGVALTNCLVINSSHFISQTLFVVLLGIIVVVPACCDDVRMVAVCVCVHACARVCVHACVCMCVCVCMSV